MNNGSKLKYAIPYARAMYEAGEQNNQLDILYQNVLTLRTLLKEGIEGFKYLDSPLWEFDAKINIIVTLAKKLDFCQTMTNTLKILVQNRRISSLLMILEQFICDYHDKHLIAEIDVETAVKLSTKQDKELRAKLAEIFNREIVINYKISPQILGGLIIQYGTSLIDSSVRNKLNRLEQLMKGIK